MPNAATEIGREFASKCEGIVEKVLAVEAKGAGVNDQNFATTLSGFFEYIGMLPDLLTKSESGYTALYETDRALEGFYSPDRLQLYEDDPKDMRGILIDFAALLQKFYLIPRMTQLDGRYGKLPGLDRFYTRWKERISRDAKASTEYERARVDADILITNTDFSKETRLFLLSKLGEIVVTLGVDLDFAQSRLRSVADHVASREPFDGKIIDGEVLLNLQVVYNLSKDIKNTGLPVDVLSKAIRFWSSKDPFIDDVFKRWQWNWQNDYTSPIAWGERSQLMETSDLFRALSEGETRLGVGRSFVELVQHRESKPTELFKPIPIFILGRSNVGKSSFFTAMNYEVANRGSDPVRKLTYGQQLQAYYDTSQKSWLEGKSVPTAAYSYFDFWRDLDIIGFCTYDYRGGDAEPQQWEPTLQEMFRNARGIIFMIDDEDLESPVQMRARATWSRTILDYWRNSNPQARHVPVALVINKIDLVIPEAIPVIKRTSLLPDDFQAAFVENHALARYTVDTPGTESSLGRLKDCLLNDPANNIHPKLQDLVYNLADNFTQFFSRVVEVTYNYQVFLVSSRAPAAGESLPVPWGIMKPFHWMTEILQNAHVSESLAQYESESKTLEKEVANLNEGLETMERLWNEIDEHQQAVEEERKKKIRFALTQREERIKHLQGLVTNAEADFMKRAESFMEAPPKNKEEVLAVMRKKVKSKNEMADNLRRRIKTYQLRKQQPIAR